MSTFKSLLSWPVRRFNLSGGTAVVAGPYTWLVLFFLVPFVLVVKISFAERSSASRRIRNSRRTRTAWCTSR